MNVDYTARKYLIYNSHYDNGVPAMFTLTVLQLKGKRCRPALLKTSLVMGL